MRRYGIALALVLSLAAVSWAGAVWEAYPAIAAAPTEQINGATAAESTLATTIIADRPQPTRGNTTVCCQVDFSGAAADSVLVYFLPWSVSAAGVYTLLPGIQQTTVTAGLLVDAAGDNLGINAAFFEIPSGANAYSIRHGLPSAGNVDLSWTSYSVSPK